MAARDEQGAARHRQVPVLEQVDGDVPGQVVDAVQRLVEPAGQRLGSRQTDDQRPGQTGTRRHGDAVELGQVHPGGGRGLLQHRDDRLQVGTRRHLGDDPAEAHVLLHRGCDLVGEQVIATDDADSGLVTGRLDAQDERFRHGSPRLWSRAGRRT